MTSRLSAVKQSTMPEPPASALQYLPPAGRRRLSSLRNAAGKCKGCDLYLRATQTVFGEGNSNAQLVLVGEQPGSSEDIEGEPFVGPAGRLLDKCLLAAGIDRANAYTTNIVKHFKWRPRGKLRLHDKPSLLEVRACRPWFQMEVRAVKPRLIVCLGATAAQALLGRSFRVTRQRGQLFPGAFEGSAVIATVHPSSLLRAPGELRQQETEAFIEDLKRAARFLAETSAT